jgi:hypothetical protein
LLYTAAHPTWGIFNDFCKKTPRIARNYSLEILN